MRPYINMKYHVSHSRARLGDVSIRTQQDGTLMAVANDGRTYCTDC